MTGREALIAAVDQKSPLPWYSQNWGNSLKHIEGRWTICSRGLHFNCIPRAPTLLNDQIDLIAVTVPPVKQFWHLSLSLIILDYFQNDRVFEQMTSEFPEGSPPTLCHRNRVSAP